MSLAPPREPGASPCLAQDPAELPPTGLKTLALLIAFYLTGLAVATYPACLSLGTTLPHLDDPLHQIWLMRWLKSSLLAGRSPLIAPGIEHPVGAPLGNFSPIPLQALVYLVFSIFTANDILKFNLIFALGFLITGLGTFFLARWVVADTRCAAFAGLLAMLSGPMLMHGHGHLELVFVGFIPLFLLSWIRFVDEPTRPRLAATVVCYLLVAASAAYFALFAAFPAAFYVLRGAVRAAGPGMWQWARARLGWLLAFVALAAPGLFLLFSSQLIAAAHGQTLSRTRGEFLYWGAPLWGYVIPTPFNALSQVLPFEVYHAAGKENMVVEAGSYLGIVTCSLLYYAALCRPGLRKGAFWWWTLGLLVLLSLGGFVRLGPYRFDLPAFWLWDHFPPFRFTRVPARFNLLAAVCAAVLAASGLRHLLERIGRPRARWLVYAGLLAVAVADLAMVPFPAVRLRPMPGCYRAILARDPAATFLDVPVFFSDTCHELNSCRAYWQALHGARTSAGYAGRPNRDYDDRIVDSSPLSSGEFANPDFLKRDDARSFGIVQDVHFLDYAWLFLHAHDYRYAVVPRWRLVLDELPISFDRLEALWRPAQVFSDADAAVYDRALLPPPAHPTLLCDGGFHLRRGWPDPATSLVQRRGRVLLYNPEPMRPLELTLEAKAYRNPRTVRLIEGDRELARWKIDPGEMRTYTSPPLRLEVGIHVVRLESDGQERPKRLLECIAEGDKRPYSLIVRALALHHSAMPGEIAARTWTVR
jgi:hypothetical protein